MFCAKFKDKFLTAKFGAKQYFAACWFSRSATILQSTSPKAACNQYIAMHLHLLQYMPHASLPDYHVTVHLQLQEALRTQKEPSSVLMTQIWRLAGQVLLDNPDCPFEVSKAIQALMGVLLAAQSLKPMSDKLAQLRLCMMSAQQQTCAMLA